MAYLVVVNDNTSGENVYMLPSMSEIPNVLYANYLDAKRALNDIVAKFDEFIPVAYGAAYPYENTTFESDLTKNDYALLGWVVVMDEDDTPSRVPIGLMKLAYSG